MAEEALPIEMELAGELYHRAMQFSWELEVTLGEALSPGEFTGVADEHIYFMIFLLDVQLFHELGPVQRSQRLDHVIAFLNRFLQDEHLASFSKYQASLQVEPRIWVSGFNDSDQNERSARYAHYMTDRTDFDGAVDEFVRWVQTRVPGRPPAPVADIARRRAPSDFTGLRMRLRGVPDPEAN